jgi:alpha-D-xyloside xylohydrolase
MLYSLKTWQPWFILFHLFSAVYAQSSDYFTPNSTGIKFQNGFERVYIQVRVCGNAQVGFNVFQPFGNHGFRIRASILRDPTGREISALLDPPLEGPEGGKSAGLAHDQTVRYGNASLPIRNGNMIVEVSNTGVILFFRVDPNGTRSLVASEYQDTKALPSRYYVQDFRSPSFAAAFSFASSPDEQFFGAGQQACCNGHTVNKKGMPHPLYTISIPNAFPKEKRLT